MDKNNILNEDWNVLMKFFPKGWRAKARQSRAMVRQKNIKSVNKLLRILLIHLADGRSLRDTVAIAKQGNICDISDVALLKKLKLSSEWFRWMSVEMLKIKGVDIALPDWLHNYNVKSVDASVITETGSTGTDWRLHYSMYLSGLKADQFIISRPKIGESFTNFKVNKGDLLIGDRAYGRIKGLKHVRDNGGDFIARMKSKAFTLYKNDEKFDLLKELRSLRYGQIQEWSLESSTPKGSKLKFRLCVIKKSEKEAEKSRKKVKRAASKGQRKVAIETLELHGYVILLTSLPRKISARLILELYRYRWQVEIAFKRLKSIMGLGHLPKKDEQSCRAWLHGKMFISLLAQAIVDEGRHFSPWGYPESYKT